MIREHVPFRKLSAYLDGILSAEEKAEITQHLDFCEECKKQYDDLKKMISMVSCLKEMDIKDGSEFASMTIERARSSSRKRNFRKAANVSAVAASIAVVIGIIFLSPESIHRIDTGSGFYADNEKTGSKSSMKDALDSIIVSSRGRAETLRLLRMHDVNVKKVSDSYIIAETNEKTLNTLQGQLGERRVNDYSNMQNVGTGQKDAIPLDEINYPLSLINSFTPERTVKFRVQVR